MAATILVLPNNRHTHAARTALRDRSACRRDLDGVRVCAPRAEPASAHVTVVAGQDATVNLSLVRGAEPPHVNKFGEKYHDAGATS